MKMNMNHVFRVISRTVLLTALGISLALLNKAEVKADPPTSSVNHDVTVVFDEQQGNARADITSASCDAIIRLNAEANSGYEFVEWTVSAEEDTRIVNSTSATDANFRMPDHDVTVTANFRSTSPAPSGPSNNDKTGASSEPSEPEDPDPTTTLSYFYDTVTNQVNAALALLGSGENPVDLYTNGITIDAGRWESFNENTCKELDKLLARKIPITINYTYNNAKKSIYIPANFAYTFTQMCNSEGYAGFEYIYAVVIKGELLPKNDPTAQGQPEKQAGSIGMGAEVGMAALSAGNDFVGAAIEGLGLAGNTGADGVSTYARFGGGSMRQETG
ncbi:MAG: hypothetical protein IK123_00520 [Lachnospiraceae bacterium]|nr:hypothetical protein [Lachnospiraceae bacterium]